jgi:hypothetical protein
VSSRNKRRQKKVSKSGEKLLKRVDVLFSQNSESWQRTALAAIVRRWDSPDTAFTVAHLF